MLSFFAAILAFFAILVHPTPLEKKEPTPHKQVHHALRSVQRPARAYTPPGGIAACIRHYESHGNYRAENNTSSASGAYQFLDGTWHSVTGLPGRAKDYPPATQDRAFYKLWNHGKGAGQWVTAHLCGY